MAKLESEDLGIVLSMIYVSWADRKLHAEELVVIKAEMEDQGLSADEIERAEFFLLNPPSLSDISETLEDEESRLSALVAACVVSHADGSVSVEEAAAIERLAVALGVDAAALERIRAFAKFEVEQSGGDAMTSSMLVENMDFDLD